MTTHSHLKRNPNARGSTIAWIAKRDEKVEQLRRGFEISAACPVHVGTPKGKP